MKTESLVLIGVGVAAYLLLKNKSASLPSPGGTGYTGPVDSVTSSPGGTLSPSDYPSCPNGTVFIQYDANTDTFTASCGAYAGTPVMYGTVNL